MRKRKLLYSKVCKKCSSSICSTHMGTLWCEQCGTRKLLEETRPEV